MFGTQIDVENYIAWCFRLFILI